MNALLKIRAHRRRQHTRDTHARLVPTPNLVQVGVGGTTAAEKRGEIAMRIIRACKGLGARSVAIYVSEDSLGAHVRTDAA